MEKDHCILTHGFRLFVGADYDIQTNRSSMLWELLRHVRIAGNATQVRTRQSAQ